MKIRNIRVLNNYKVKLTNSKLSNVDPTRSIVSEQGTRTPSIPTNDGTVAPKTFQEKFDLVMKYLVDRYEPTWSVGSTAAGKAATIASLGVSGSVNPLTEGGSVESAFNVISTSDQGWFDVFTHPKDFAAAVKQAYVPFERTRKPAKAKHRFIDYNSSLIGGDYSYLINGGNQFLNIAKDAYIFGFPEPQWYGKTLYLNYAYKNGIERIFIHSPYGYIQCPYSPFENASTILDYTKYNKQSLPWISDRYVGDSGYRFDAYLICRESTTLRDLLTDYGVTRDANLGVIVDGVADTYLNTGYRGMCYGAGEFSKNRLYNDVGGYSGDEVLIGSPWIPYPNGVTWSGELGGWNNPQPISGLCFNYESLVMFDGSTFPTNPQLITDRGSNLRASAGICFAESERRITALNSLSDTWGNSMEFIAYLGLVSPSLTPLWDAQIPWRLYADPTDPEKVRYYKWRLDASVSHWKQKFKSPIDGFAHVFMDASSAIERTHHVFGGPTYATKTNVLPSGNSYVENTAVSWFRDQHNYTFGASGPDADKGVVMGSELLAWYDYIQAAVPRTDDLNTRNKKSPTDTNIRHWGLDEDIAPAQYQSQYDLLVGQRAAGATLFNQIYGMGVCGSSTLGEIFAICKEFDKRTPDGYPFYYGPFIGFSGGQLYWKSLPGSYFGVNTDGGIPWYQDRRFKLFYQYPMILALGGTIVDIIHQGYGYYSPSGGWFDIRYGSREFTYDMEARNVQAPIVSNEPSPNRKTPALPPQNYWTGNARTSEFELLYACMKGGVTGGLDSLGFTNLYNELEAANYGQNTNTFKFMIDGIFDTGDSALNQYYTSKFISEGCIFYDMVYEAATTNAGVPVRNLTPGNSTINRDALVTHIKEKFGIQPNSSVERHVIFDFEYDFDGSLLYGEAWDGNTLLSADSVLNGTNNTRVTNEIKKGITHCQGVFGPKVKFSHWGHPIAANYLQPTRPGGVDLVDYLNATSANREARNIHSVTQHSPVMSVYDFAVPFAYDGYPNQASIDSGLAIVSPTAPPNYPYDQNSAGNDQYRTATTEIMRRINIQNNKQTMPVYPNLSWWYDPNFYYSGMMGVMVPTSEMLSYYTSLKAAYPSINGISFWTAGWYFFNTLAFGAENPGVPEQQKIRDSLVRNYLNGVNPVPSQYPNWRDPALKKYLMTKANDDLLSLIAQMKALN